MSKNCWMSGKQCRPSLIWVYTVCSGLSVRIYMVNTVNINGFSPNLVCALILWRSGLGLLMGKFHQFFTELSGRDLPIFLFLDDNLSKRKWIFSKLGMCIVVVEIWFWIANGQISSNCDRVICPRHAHFFVFRMIT